MKDPLGDDAPPVETRKAARNRRDGVRIAHTGRDLVEKLLERHALLAFQRLGVVELGFGNADRVDDHEVRFRGGVGGDGLEVVGVDDPYAAAFHLLEEVA